MPHRWIKVVRNTDTTLMLQVIEPVAPLKFVVVDEEEVQIRDLREDPVQIAKTLDRLTRLLEVQ